MRILVTGSRNWTDYAAIEQALSAYARDASPTVIQGGNGYLKSGRACKTEDELLLATKGADALAYQACINLGLEVVTEWALWDSFANVAGPKRNAKMLNWLFEDQHRIALAFHDNIDESKGTKGMLLILRRAHVPVTLFGH